MRAEYEREYRKLNPEQKEAIEYIEGPLLVIAGPGTGKTQLLSLRAANILSSTDVLPENILCLTFTESGAQEMRRRLIRIIGEDAYKITISTYHGFGSEIINRNPSYFLGSYNLRPISDLKTDAIIRELQKDLPFTSELKSPEVVGAIGDLISDCKQALLTPDDLTNVANANLAFIKLASAVTKPLSENLIRISLKAASSFAKLIIPKSDVRLPKGVETLESLWNKELEAALDDTFATRKTKSLTKWKAKYLAKDEKNRQIAKGAPQNERLKEFAKIYQKYVSRLKADNLYDYDDMILLSIEALKKHYELRFNLQEKYLYIMLDEYQDTNAAQAELTRLLTNQEVSEGRPNIMALGDDDQAIYAFQGAKHSNMLDFNQEYKDVKRVTLKSNYRSTQPIINLSTLVVEQISERLTKLLGSASKDFKATRGGTGKIDSLNFVSEIEQYGWLAKEVNKSPNVDTAIIAPEHKYLERASAYLADQGIPISYERRENVLDDPLIDQILTILRLLLAINDRNNKNIDWLAAVVLNYDFWAIPTEALWKISWKAHDQRKPWMDVILSTPSTRALGLMLIKLATNSLSYRYDFIIDQVIGLSDIVISDPKTKSTRSKFIEYYASSNDDLTSYRLFQNLMVIKERFKDYNLDDTRPLMISDLVDFIDQLKSSNVKLINDFSYGSSDAKVKLMTAHGSKGLEFDSVYLLSFVNEVWGIKSYNRSRLSLPPNLEYIKQGAQDADDEKLRLLYVALTRAKNRIVTLSYDHDATAKPNTPVKYLDSEPTNTSIKTKLTPLWQADESQLEITTDLKKLLKNRLENYSLSATDLIKFVDVRHAGPENFYKSVLLKYQTPVPPRTDYGSAVHDTLNWLQQTFIASNKFPTLSSINDEFKKSLLKKRLTSDDFKHLYEQGVNALKAYYSANKYSLSKDDLSEFDFRGEGVIIGKARLSGKIDKLKIDKANKSIIIVDYKTGPGLSNWGNQPRLHNYRQQLNFYKLLVNKSSTFKGYKVSGALLDFVEPDRQTAELHTLPLDYDEAEIKNLIKLIEAIWNHIDNLKFPSVSKYQPNLAGIKKFEDDLINKRI